MKIVAPFVRSFDMPTNYRFKTETVALRFRLLLYSLCVSYALGVCVCVCARRDHTTKCFINELIDAFRILFGIKPLTSLKLTRIRYVCGKKSRKKSKK